MKILIAYATAGAGHKKAASVVYGYLKHECGINDIEIVDIVEKSSWFFRLIYFWGYDFLINHCACVWAVIFFMSEKGMFRPFFSKLTTFIHYYNTRKFVAFLKKAKPDVVVSTHFLSSDVVAYLKRHGILQSRLITIITDFGVHPFWIAQGTDFYCVASEATRSILISRGVSSLSIRITGIPTDLKFNGVHDRDIIRNRIGISKECKTVLVVTGSFGIGPIESIVKQLCPDYHVLAVCARNKRLYRKLTIKAYPNTNIYGYVDNLDELMAACDIIITKPGGLTISELLCMDLIPLFIAAIPGQEAINASIMENAGIGQTIHDINKTVSLVKRSIEDASRIRGAIRVIKKTDAVKGIYDVIRTSCTGTSGRRAV